MALASALNCTLVELKYNYVANNIAISTSLNCTLVELKLGQEDTMLRGLYALNCTLVELKSSSCCLGKKKYPCSKLYSSIV